MPRWIVIDGYNLGFAWPGVRERLKQDQQLGRDRLLDLLRRYKKASGADITVVFDGRSQSGAEAKTKQRGIAVIYAQRPISADEEIGRLVVRTKDRGRMLVVSSDRAVRASVRQFRAEAIGSAEFIAMAERALEGQGAASEKPETVDIDKWSKVFDIENR
jgi:predicted RNA-binding protein with PIN domain